MRYEAPAATFHARVDGYPTGLAGTIGVQILNAAGTAVVARTTSGITETPAGSGSYLATLVAPTAPGEYTIFWDTGSVSPDTSRGEQLTVTQAGLTVTTVNGTWSYDPTQLASSVLYQVRMEVGDTDASAPLLADEEVEQAISVEANMWGAAARCCEIISRSFLRKADVRIGRGGTTLTYSAQANQYTTMATALRKRANAMNSPWTGGTSVSDKLTLGADADAVQPLFTKTMGNNPWVGGEDLSTTDDGQDDNR